MYQISTNKKTGKYHVALFSSRNHRMLSSSESNGFSTRKGAIKNILAQRKETGTRALVQDNTLRIPGIFMISSEDRLILTRNKLQKAYVSGRRKKKS